MLKFNNNKGKKGGGNGKAKASLMSDASSSDTDEEINTKKNRSGPEQKLNHGFKINKGYAEKYDNWRNLEEMEKLKAKLGVKDINELDEESSSESSEEDEEWSPETEKAFLKTLACLKTKDPKIYSNQFGFFKGVDPTASVTNVNELPENQKIKMGNKKPFTLRDHERTMVLEKGGQLSDDDEGNNTKMIGHYSMSYPEELASIKTEFSKALNDIDSSDDEGGNLVGSKLLKKRTTKSVAEENQEKEEYKLWLKGELDKVGRGKLSKEDEKELKSLRKYWNDDKLDEGEKFLRDYILNKDYIEPLKEESRGYPSYNEVVQDDQLSEDEKFEVEREEFEHKYNFRFEEPDQDFIKRYPRTIQDSLRREESKRKDVREKAKGRKEDAKSKKREEVQRLKAFKRKEIMDKIHKLHEVSGNPELELTEMDIDGDFDPVEYDRRMKEIFNDEYYDDGADNQKPVFEYDEEIDDEANWEEWVPTRKAAEAVNDEADSENGEASEDDVEQTEQVRSIDRRMANQQELIEASKGKRNRKKRSKFLEVLEQEKPTFNPKIHKSFEKYFDEYYKLDFEDLVGDLPTRFKYHKTTANNFGLSVGEILNAEDKELNQWASIKKAIQYRENNEEEYDVKAYTQKATREDLKKRILPSLYETATTVKKEDKDDEPDEAPKRKKNKKKKKKNKTSACITEESDVHPEVSKSNGEKLGPASNKEKKKSKSIIQDVDPIPDVVAKTHSSESPDSKLGLSKRQRKNLAKLKAKGENNLNDDKAEKLIPNSSSSQISETASSKASRKEKRQKRKFIDATSTNEIGVDDERLLAYGINPKKFKKRIKYGASAQS